MAHCTNWLKCDNYCPYEEEEKEIYELMNLSEEEFYLYYSKVNKVDDIVYEKLINEEITNEEYYEILKKEWLKYVSEEQYQIYKDYNQIKKETHNVK